MSFQALYSALFELQRSDYKRVKSYANQKFFKETSALESTLNAKHLLKQLLFSRYESGETKPLAATSNSLKMLERHPEDLKYLIDKNNVAT